MWLGSQAFYGATVFNANIGAWNTAAMTTMASVCALIAIACLGGVGAAAVVCVGLAAVSTLTRAVLALASSGRTLQRSLVGRHLNAAVRGLGACTCRGRTRAWLPLLWRMLRCRCAGPSVDLLGLGCGAAWPIPLGHAPNFDTGMHACFRESLFSGI